MMHNDTAIRDLVLYVPPAENAPMPPSAIKRFGGRISRFYQSRVKHYCALLSLFFCMSVLACCVCSQADEFSIKTVGEFFVSFQKDGFIQIMLSGGFSGLLFYNCLAFLYAFTVFAYPFVIISALRLYYNASFALFAVLRHFYNFSFVQHFCLVLFFSFLVVLSTVFFTEAMLFYRRDRNDGSTKRNLFFTLLFFLYIVVAFIIIYFSCTSLLHI